MSDRTCSTVPKHLTMTTAADLGYYPLPAIREGRKRHTLRRNAYVPGVYEVVCDRRPTGLRVRVTRSVAMLRTEYLTDEFARADGLRDAAGLERGLLRFYGHLPAMMWRVEFEMMDND